MTARQEGERPHATRAAAKRGFEPSDLPARAAVYALIAIFVGIAITFGVVTGLFALYGRWSEPGTATPLEAAHIVPPAPRLEVSPSANRAVVEAEAKRLLEGYAWVDRAEGRARIPIERAMELIAERGWPDDAGAGSP